MTELIDLASVASSRRHFSILIDKAQRAIYRRDISNALVHFEEARGLAATAHLIFPEQAYRELAWSYVEREEYSRALVCLEQGLEAHPESTKILYELGCIYLTENFSERNPLQALHYFLRLKHVKRKPPTAGQ